MEVWGEELDLSPPLPNGDGTEAVNENERWLVSDGFFVGFWTPEVDGGFVVDVEGLGGEAGGGEAATEVHAVQRNQAEKGRRH